MKQSTMRFALLVGLLLCAACQNINRPFVITNPQQLGDLYCHGELTDTKGNRWSIYILPGVKNMADWSMDGWKDAGKNLQEYGDKDFFCDLQNIATDSLEFSKDSLEISKDSITDFWWEGTGDDFSTASKNIAINFREAPFGWIPRVIGNAAWGYIIMPAFRLAAAPVGVAVGLSGATLGVLGSGLLPTGGFLAPPTKAIGNVVFHGILIPVAGITAHQFIYLLALPNREPAENMDGRFGLHIINNHRDADSASYYEKDTADTSALEKIPKEGVQYLQKFLQEYILLKKNIAEIKGKMKDFEKLQINLVLERKAWEYSFLNKEAKEYEKNNLRQDFSMKWQEMIATLPSNIQPEMTEQEAFDDFKYMLQIYVDEETK